MDNTDKEKNYGNTVDKSVLTDEEIQDSVIKIIFSPKKKLKR